MKKKKNLSVTEREKHIKLNIFYLLLYVTTMLKRILFHESKSFVYKEMKMILNISIIFFYLKIFLYYESYNSIQNNFISGEQTLWLQKKTSTLDLKIVLALLKTKITS